ncbi:MAG: hypothetical protein ACE5HO_05390 [bacterium]
MPALLFSQNNHGLTLFEKEVLIVVDTVKLSFSLPDSFLIPNTEIVWADSTLLIRNKDYSLNYVDGLLQLRETQRIGTKLKIQYRHFPFTLKRNYFRRSLVMAKERPDDPKDGIQTVRPVPKPRTRNLFASRLRKSGSLTRGVSVGTNQGLRVDSGLRMQIAGHLTDNIEVVASLTDQNTPIQPEGNTQSLQEIDKVFVQIRGPNLRATLGDYNLSFQGTEFSRYNRKLQGVMGTADYENWHVTVSGAVSRGQFITNEFLGQEGNQGPYQLKGDKGQINIIVLAGTERVWIDGESMVRGENNDYVIEYGNGQITFTRKRLITADSRITVDFQYSDESFQRNLWGVRGQSNLLNDKLRFGTTFIRESDDKDNPLSLNLTDDFLANLKEAGDSLAVMPGWRFVGPDSGNYTRDTTGVFTYVGPDSGDYNVAFTFFGENKGDYRNVGFGRFEFVGANQGSYRPVIVLPQAQRHDLVGLNLDFSPTSDLTVQTEMAFSQFDANLYSPKDDQDNSGTAYSFKLNFHPQKLVVGSLNLGRLELNGKLRRKNSKFREIDRTNIPEFNRRWNLSNANAIRQETISEFSSTYEPLQGLSFRGGLGRLTRSSLFKSNRWEVQTILNRKHLPNVNYFVEFINRDDKKITEQSSWLRQRGHAYFNVKKLKPIFDYEGEIKKTASRDSLREGFRFDSYTGGLEFRPWKSLFSSAKYNYRNDKNRQNGFFLPKSVSKTQTYALNLANWHAISAAASYIHRERNFTDASVQDTRTDLADVRLGYAPRRGGIRSNVNYQISNTQVARQEELFIQVDEGQGDFRFDEDLNEFVPDPFGDHVRRLITTKDFIPVVELRFRTDLRLNPKRFLSAPKAKKSSQGFFRKILNPLTTETFFRINEKTREKDVAKIFLLQLSHFQQDSTTIFGNIEFRQDIYLWENSRKLSLRYRYRNRKEKNNQFVGGGQDRRVRQQALRLIHQISKQVSNQFEFSHEEEDRLFQSFTREDRRIRRNGLAIDLVYRPRRALEIGTKLEWDLNRDIVPQPHTKATRISLIPRLNYSISRQGRVRAEIGWTRVTVSPLNRLIPFELADGNKPGTTFRWNLGFDYRLSRNVQASLNYFGRSEPDRPRTQHIAKMEMRAFF